MSPSTYLCFPILCSTKKMTETHMYVFENDRLIGAHYFSIYKKGGDKIKSCFLTFSYQTATFTRNPKRNTLCLMAVSQITLHYDVHEKSPILHQQVFTSHQWEFYSSDNIYRSNITCTTASLFWKEETLTKKTCILRNKTTVTVIYYDQFHG